MHIMRNSTRTHLNGKAEYFRERVKNSSEGSDGWDFEDSDEDLGHDVNVTRHARWKKKMNAAQKCLEFCVGVVVLFHVLEI